MYAIKSICFSAELLLSGALACHSIDYSEPFLILIIPFLGAQYTTRHDYLGCSNKRSYKKSMVSGER